MSENLKTIKELADEIGVSKQGIQYHIKSLQNLELKKNSKGVIILTTEQQNIIKQKVVSKIGKDEILKVKDEQIEDFKFQREVFVNEIAKKNEQIKSLVEAQKQTQNLLDQQQRLALQDKKLLEEYKSEINDLKALKMPSQDTKEEQAGNQPQEELKTLKEQMEALNDKIKGQEQLNNQSSKKWYQFWK